MQSGILKYERFLFALGGNAILKKDDSGTFDEQLRNTYTSVSGIVDLIGRGRKIVITHGNGPQVGNCLIRVERSSDEIPTLPLFACVAETQGEMGYMIGQALVNRLNDAGLKLPVATVVTQVVVNPNDPMMKKPTKPVGPYYLKEEAVELGKSRGWIMKRLPDGNYRRIVASPHPEDIVEAEAIRLLIDSGVVVIACGGGGIPVYRKNNSYIGIDAVIDKDRASALLAKKVGIEVMVILTSVDSVYLDFGKITQKAINEISIKEIKEYFDGGHFPSGSMGPKIEASIDFLNGGGKVVLITSPQVFEKALKGEVGTFIYP